MKGYVGDFRRYAVEWISIANLEPHPKIQRAFDEAWAMSIADDFDPDKFRELYVVRGAKGQYLVFDGQHRLAAARKALGEDQQVPCRVWEAIPLERQADLFLDINKNKPVQPLDKWAIRILAKEKAALEIEDILDRHKLRVAKTRGSHVVQSVVAMEVIWQREEGAEVLDRTLGVLTKAWGGVPEAYEALILRGVSSLLFKFGANINDEELAHDLAKKGSPGALVGKARSAAQIMAKSASRCMAEVILNIYNGKRRTKLEL